MPLDRYVDPGYWEPGYAEGDEPVAPPIVRHPPGGLLLNELLPLRTTRQLGDFAENSFLAYIFGDLTEARFPLRRISSTRGHAADHPMQITAAFTGDVPTASWQAKIEADITGHVCTFVDFGAPVPPNVQMQAAGKGMLHPLTGALITNPGEIMERLAIIAGRSDKFQTLREQAAAADIRLALRVADSKSIQAWYDIPAKSAGAVWSSPNISRRYPAAVSGYVRELDVQTASNVRAVAVVDQTADILRVAYDWCDATDKPRKHIELTANPERYGGLVKELALPCLRSAANAVVVCTPILQRYAGERYDVTLDSSDMTIRPGHWLKLVSIDGSGPHPEWSRGGDAPYVMVLAVDVNRDNGTVGVTGETLLTAPSISVTAHSIALADTFAGALEVAERNGIATFTVFDENHIGIAGARVSFDGSPAKTTDSRGQVSFTYTPGQHEIAIEAPGRVPQTLTITL